MVKQISDVHGRVNSMEKKVDGVRDAIEDLRKLLTANGAAENEK
jgi:hypothetical protein